MPDEDNKINAPELRETVDEMAAVIPEIARAHKRIFDGFTDAGFDEAQALILTLAMVHGPQAT